MTTEVEIAAAVAAAKGAAAAAVVSPPSEGKVVTLVGEHEKRIQAEGEGARSVKNPWEEAALPSVLPAEQSERKPAVEGVPVIEESEERVMAAPVVAPVAAGVPVVTEAYPEVETRTEPEVVTHAQKAPHREEALAPEPDLEADAGPVVAEAPIKEEDGFDAAEYARQATLGQLDKNKDGLITGDDLVAAAHEYEGLKKRVKWYRRCAGVAVILLLIIIGIWIGIAILAGRVTGGVKVVGGGFYVSRGNGHVVSTGRSLYAMRTPVATQLLTLTPAQLETLETVTLAVTGQPSQVIMKVAGLASRANFVELRSAAGDRLTVIPGTQTFSSAAIASAPATITTAYTFAPVG